MKRVLSVLLVVVVCCGLVVGCGGSGNTDEMDSLKKENAELKEEIEELKAESKKDGAVGSAGEKKAPQEMKLNEPFLVETENGNYTVTFQEARKTDWWQRGNAGDTSKTEIALVYEVENIDFKTGQTDSSGLDGVLINNSAFKVSDERNYLLSMDNGSFSEYGYPEIVEPGYKSKEELPYIVDGDTSYVEVVLYRKTGDVGKIRIDVTE